MVNIDSPLKTIADAHQVSEAELAALALALDGLPTAEIATCLGCSPDAVRKRLGQVYSKFNITGKGPGKLAALRYKLNQHLKPSLTHKPVITSPKLPPVKPSRYDWGNVPRLSEFWGRHAELTTLHQWIITDRCPLVTVFGMVGIGKTALAVHLTRQIQNEFEFVIWYSLRDLPSLSQILDHWLHHFYQDQPIDFPQNINDQLSLLIQKFRRARCLLILDNFESLFQPGQFAGVYQSSYQDYQQILQQIGESQHQSCLMIITQEKPLELAHISSVDSPIRVLSLGGLIESDAEQVVESTVGSIVLTEEIEQLVKRYSGNPLALKISATTIRELFNGEITQFLQQELVLSNGLTQELQQQFKRLSPLEKKVLYDLALNQTAVNLNQLQSQNLSDTLNALESLKRRSLLEIITETGTIQWTLQPMVKQYVIHQVREKISQFIFHHNLEEIDKRELLTDLGILNLTLTEDDDNYQQLTYNQVAKQINQMGRRQYLKGNFIRAKHYLTWAIRFDPNLTAAHYNLGSTYEELDDYQSARQHYKIATKRNDRPAVYAQNNLARLEILSGDIETAINRLYLALERVTEEKWKSQIYKNLGWAYFLKNRYNEAESYLKKALEWNREYAPNHYLMAKVLVAKGDSKKANQFWLSALKCDNFSPKHQDSGWQLPELKEWRVTAYQYLESSE